MHIPTALDTNTRLIIMGQAPIFVQLTHGRGPVTGTPAAVQVVGTVTRARTILQVKLEVALLACRLGVHLLTLCVLPASKAVNSSGTGARHRDSLTRGARAESKLSPPAESKSAPGSQRVGGSGPQARIGLQLVQGWRGRAGAVPAQAGAVPVQAVGIKMEDVSPPPHPPAPLPKPS
jgi:hypothetical protein